MRALNFYALMVLGFAKEHLALENMQLVTAAPSLRQLGRRTTKGSATCGWVDGDPADPLVCPSDYKCSVRTSAAGCCVEPACTIGFWETCYDYGTWESIVDALNKRGVPWLGCGPITTACVTCYVQSDPLSDIYRPFIGCTTGVRQTINILAFTTAAPTTKQTSSTASPSSTHGTFNTATFTSSSLTSQLAASTTIYSTTSPTISSSSTPTSNSPGNLSTGDIVGIISAIIGALSLMIAWFTLRHMRKERLKKAETPIAQALPRQGAV
ncbi:hypothetical protein DL95DRAFT_469974 [Leptodontidium sp. 2 PMI_412]|nr:hypothetical protein DL95DRAFT_469974 [Leptodontidium sp. 2 PMI_412]